MRLKIKYNIYFNSRRLEPLLQLIVKTKMSRHPKLIPAPKSLTTAHEVMNQLYTPNPHSLIASDVEMCRSTPPELCLNPCLLNRV